MEGRSVHVTKERGVEGRSVHVTKEKKALDYLLCSSEAGLPIASVIQRRGCIEVQPYIYMYMYVHVYIDTNIVLNLIHVQCMVKNFNFEKRMFFW